MPHKQFTDQWVRSDRCLAPPGKSIDWIDEIVSRLLLRVNRGGSRTWRCLYYVNSRPRTFKLGRFPDLSVKQARQQARVFLEDPQKALAKRQVGTFEEIAGDFIRRHVEKSGLRTKSQIERVLKRYIYPELGKRQFLEVKRSDITRLLDKVEDRNGARQADYCLAVISKLTRWYQARNDDYLAPVVPGMRRSKPAERARKRILDDNELRALWLACDEVGMFGAMIKVLLLTAQRREKVATMKHVDIADGIWTIPTEPREKSNAGRLALPQVVLDIIEAQPVIAKNPYVFPGRGKIAFNSFSQRKAELDAKLPKQMESWTLHDLRRTARSLMSRAGVISEHAERVLGHAIPGVEGVYNRYQFDREKADALNKLAALVDTIVTPPTGNVVMMRRSISQ
jgi:integrase